MYVEQRWDVIPGGEPAHQFRNRVQRGEQGNVVLFAGPDDVQGGAETAVTVQEGRGDLVGDGSSASSSAIGAP